MENETKSIKVPFDMYDIFGYIVPGLVFCLSSGFILLYLNGSLGFTKKIDFLSKLILNFNTLKVLKNNTPWWLEITFLIGFIAIVYTIGHIIASISSLLVDKHLLKKSTGYPFQKLFLLDHLNDDFSTGFYKLSAAAINFYLLRLLLFNIPDRLELIIVGSICSIVFISKIVVSNRIYRNRTKPEWKERWMKIGKAISVPFNIFARALQHLFSIDESFSKSFINEFREKYEEKFGMDISEAGTEVYWLSYLTVTIKNQHIRDLVWHFLRLYGFTRNLSISFFLVYLLVLAVKLYTGFITPKFMLMGGLCFIGSGILLIRYYYLYYNYYSKIIFRAFYYMECDINSQSIANTEKTQN